MAISLIMHLWRHPSFPEIVQGGLWCFFFFIFSFLIFIFNQSVMHEIAVDGFFTGSALEFCSSVDPPLLSFVLSKGFTTKSV